jgi:hypothetical protein
MQRLTNGWGIGLVDHRVLVKLSYDCGGVQAKLGGSGEVAASE